MNKIIANDWKVGDIFKHVDVYYELYDHDPWNDRFRYRILGRPQYNHSLAREQLIKFYKLTDEEKMRAILEQ